MTLRNSLSFLALASTLSLAACTAIVDAPQDPPSNVCGGSVCFEPQQVAVRHWGAGELTVAAWHGSVQACKAPQLAVPQHGADPWGGSIIEVRLVHPTPGAKLPIVSHHKLASLGDDDAKQIAIVRAVRIDDKGTAVTDEDALSGTATVLEVESSTGRVRVRVRAHWSSGIDSEFLFDVDGPKDCAG